jgi:uncharacterized membrane protein
MNDNADIAFLAASCEREMRQSLGGSSIKYNRTDFRRFLGNGQPVGQFQPQQMYPQQAYAPTPEYYNQNNVPVDYVIPEGTLPPSNARLLNVPQIAGSQPQQNVQPMISSNIESVQGFQMPDYNQPAKKNYLEDEQSFRDALIEEIKSLKNSIKSQKTLINKLIKLVSSGNVIPQSNQPQEITDDSSDKS